MADAALLEFLRTERSRGIAEDELIARAAANGWQEGDVHGALALLRLEDKGLARTEEVASVSRAAAAQGSAVSQYVFIAMLLIGAAAYVYLVELPGNGVAQLFLQQRAEDAARLAAESGTEERVWTHTYTFATATPKKAASSGGSSKSTAYVPSPQPSSPATPSSPAAPAPAGDSSPATREPTVAKPRIALTLAKTSIVKGTNTTLTWSITNAQSCTSTHFDTGGRTSGSVTVTPTETTAYLMTCYGAGGTASASVTLSVTLPETPAPVTPQTPPAEPSSTPPPTTPPPSPPPPPAAGTTVVTRATSGTSFTWEFHCGGNPCKSGTFVNGEYWVVPIDTSGKRVDGVTIVSITPAGENHGAEVNPKSTSKQGILPMYASYDANRNIMTKLPYVATPGQSIFKASTRTSGCGTKAISAGCVTAADVLTVLADVPPNNGSTVFRPPFHGDAKPLYTTDKVRLDRLPSLSGMGTLSTAALVKRWTTPHYDTTHGTGFSGEFMRATAPDGVVDDYASGQAAQYLNDLFTVYGTNSATEKAPAVYALIQKGIDVYSIFKLGIPFNSGAGQHLGRKPPLAFFAAMYDDPALLSEVRAIARNPQYEKNNFFQEDSQIMTGQGGIPLWGSPSTDVNTYWSRLYPGVDNKGTESDPYGYIDGPPGGAFPTDPVGRSYIGVSGGPLIGFAFAQHLMPWLKYANNDTEILAWSDRIYGGYGMTGFSGGFWAAPDPCAPRDAREPVECAPYRGSNNGCLYYQVTWGPDPANAGQCIKHAGDPLTDGRMSALHGRTVSFVYMPGVVKSKWSSMRACADPASPTYRTGVCAGIGPDPGGISKNESSLLAAVTSVGSSALDSIGQWLGKLFSLFR